MKKESKSLKRFLISLWLVGISSIFFVVFIVFVSMSDTRGHRQVVLYEPSNAVYYGELTMILILFLLTSWVLYNYASGNMVLDFVNRKKR